MDGGTALVRKKSIEELVGHRARALELYERIAELLIEARQAHVDACPGLTSISEFPHDELRYFSASRMEEYRKKVRQHLDSNMWRALLKNTKMGGLMDTQARKEFEQGLSDPPEATAENIYATMNGLRQDAGLIFRRGLVNAFANLCRDYKSHDGFKIGERIVLTYAFSIWGTGKDRTVSYFNKDDLVRDVDRVMHVLDGQPWPDDYSAGICGEIRKQVHAVSRNRGGEATTLYWRAKWFLNGNLHLFPLREDLVRRANLMIAEHYGAVVGAAPDVANKANGPAPDISEIEDFFGTPGDVVALMIQRAQIDSGDLVLEPSAGEGAIAMQLVRQGFPVVCVESHAERAKKLRLMLPLAGTVIEMDFLSMVQQPLYDRVLMNPPFSRHADVYHVQHALGFLKPDGRLVAIMGANVLGASQVEFRRRIEAWGGTFERLPPGSFKSSGTMVETVMVVVDKPGEHAA